MKKILSLIILLITILISTVSINQFLAPINQNYDKNIIVNQEEIMEDALSIVNDIDIFNFMLFNEINLQPNQLVTTFTSSNFTLNDLISFSELSVAQISQELSDSFIDIISGDELLQNIILDEIKTTIEQDKGTQAVSMSSSATNQLLRVGLSTAAIQTLNVAISVIIGTVKAWFTPNVVKAVLIAAAVVTMTAVILLNWSKISPVINVIVGEFARVAGDFATTVRNSFNNIIQTASQKVQMTKQRADDLTDAVLKREGSFAFYPAIKTFNGSGYRWWILPVPMEMHQATNDLRNRKDTWTVHPIYAYLAALNVSGAVSSSINLPEVHLANQPHHQQFMHFHPIPRTGGHSLVGPPLNFLFG